MFEDIAVLITNSFPDLPVSSIEFIGEGMDSRAYVVNKEYVFRFPKRQEVGANLLKEIGLLPYLQTLPLQVPDLTFTAHDPATGWPFAGYRMLKGEEWSRARFTHQSAVDQQTGLQIIGRFITALHSVNIELALQLGVTEIDSCGDYLDTFDDIKNGLYPYLSPGQRQVTEGRFNNYFNIVALHPPAHALIHGDLSKDHILCNPESGQPQGIIDFVDVAVSDPDLDLKYLYEEMGPPFIQQLLRQGYYQSDLPETYLLEKLSFYNFCETFRDTMDRHQDNMKEAAAALYCIPGF